MEHIISRGTPQILCDNCADTFAHAITERTTVEVGEECIQCGATDHDPYLAFYQATQQLGDTA